MATNTVNQIIDGKLTLLGTFGNYTPGIFVTGGAGATTLTAAQTINSLVIAPVTAAVAYTLPTAATIVAAMPRCPADTTFTLTIRNTGNNTITVTAPDGSVTLAAGNTNTVITNETRTFLGRVTVATSGAEAVTFYSLLHATH